MYIYIYICCRPLKNINNRVTLLTRIFPCYMRLLYQMRTCILVTYLLPIISHYFANISNNDVIPNLTQRNSIKTLVNIDKNLMKYFIYNFYSLLSHSATINGS